MRIVTAWMRSPGEWSARWPGRRSRRRSCSGSSRWCRLAVRHGSGRREAQRAEVSGGQGAQVGAGNEQVNQYIQTYTENQHPPAAPARREGDRRRPPRQAPAFPRRNDPDRAARLIADAERIAQSITDKS